MHFKKGEKIMMNAQNKKRTLSANEVFEFLALPEKEREAKTHYNYIVANQKTAQTNTASVDKQENMTREEKFEAILKRVVSEYDGKDSFHVRYTAQYKKHKYCIRVYDSTYTKFFNMGELFFRSRLNGISLFMRKSEYIPNSFKLNTYHEFYDMKYESFIAEEEIEAGLKALFDNYIELQKRA